MSQLYMRILAVFLCIQLATSITYYDVYRRMRSHEKKNAGGEQELSPEWEQYISRMSIKQIDDAIERLKPYAEKFRKTKGVGERPNLSRYYPWIIPF
ncbi:unnamed protein product [Bursaphelenchus xylophilus]|uniref:(pine wood nematode) hypothetical protein n=1 Tax=Bursaphelenchus xylophilus TaxID=6326 RepID=A0A1I7RYJ5_BURXY|nr:unnamed protein product [Bursaphelenchus xylophilus]CAG9092615.1 unnamed protein product [Bursaphelenchus xylophilus]